MDTKGKFSVEEKRQDWSKTFKEDDGVNQWELQVWLLQIVIDLLNGTAWNEQVCTAAVLNKDLLQIK